MNSTDSSKQAQLTGAVVCFAVVTMAYLTAFAAPPGELTIVYNQHPAHGSN